MMVMTLIFVSFIIRLTLAQAESLSAALGPFDGRTVSNHTRWDEGTTSILTQRRGDARNRYFTFWFREPQALCFEGTHRTNRGRTTPTIQNYHHNAKNPSVVLPWMAGFSLETGRPETSAGRAACHTVRHSVRPFPRRLHSDGNEKLSTGYTKNTPLLSRELIYKWGLYPYLSETLALNLFLDNIGGAWYISCFSPIDLAVAWRFAVNALGLPKNEF